MGPLFEKSKGVFFFIRSFEIDVHPKLTILNPSQAERDRLLKWEPARERQ